MAGLLDQITKQKKVPEIWDKWQKEPTEENFATIMTTLKPTIDSGLFSFGQGDEALRTKARILTAKAIKSYDPKKNVLLKTHVYNHLKGLQRARAERGKVVHVPESRLLDQHNIAKYKTGYRERYDIEPSLVQMQDDLNMSKGRVLRAEGILRESGTGQAESDKGDMLLAPKDQNDVWMDYVYHDLDEIGRKILEWTTGYNGRERLKKTEIARRLKISPAAVSKRINGIIKKVEEGTQ